MKEHKAFDKLKIKFGKKKKEIVPTEEQVNYIVNEFFNEENAEDTTVETIVEPVEEVFVPDSDEVILGRGASLVKEIISKPNSRQKGSKEEREIANFLLDKTEETFGHKGILEPFYVHKWADKLSFLLISGILLLCLIVYAFSPITSLIFFLISVFLLVSKVVFNKDIILPKDKQISFNVRSEIASDNQKNTLVLMANYSSSLNQNINRFFKVNVKALLISYLVITLLLFVMLVVLASGVINVGVQVVAGLLMSALIILIGGYYGFDKKQNLNVKNGLEGVGMAFNLTDYLCQHRELIGENTSVVLLLVGGGTNSYLGTKAFIKEHFKNNDDYKNAKVLSINSVRADRQALYCKKGKTNALTNSVYEKLSGSEVSKEIGVIKGTEATLFSAIGVDSASIGDSQLIMDTQFNTINDDRFDEQILNKKFYKYLEIVKEILNKLKED